MAPGKGSGHEKTDNELLLAIVIADSFDDLFQPLSLNKPRCLLPLCNVPMIEYTLEFLASSGVNETLVVCKSHAETVKAYIKQSKWARTHSPMKVKTKVVQQSRTLGEALREIDDTPFISDFILCTGLVISNMNMSSILDMHLANAKRDSDQIVTMVLQEATSAHRISDKSDESVYVIDPSNNKLLSVDSFPSLPKTEHLDIPLGIITDSPEVEIRADLMDTNVYICSPAVLELFRDNFDYQTMRSDFIHFISISTLDASTFYAHILTGTSSLGAVSAETRQRGLDSRDHNEPLALGHSGYAAAVIDTAAYDAISRDLVARWAYPLCPDSNPVDETVYSYNRGAVYKAEPVFLGRESRVEHHVVLGSNSQVSDFARVSDSVLGKGCAIGECSVVRGSYMFEGAKVGKGSVVERSILGERVTILDNVFIERGCIIGDDVVIGPDVRIPEFTRVARWLPQVEHSDFSDGEGVGMSDNDDGDDDEDASSIIAGYTDNRSSATNAARTAAAAAADNAANEKFDAQALGASGVGYVWSNTATSDDYDDDFDEQDEPDSTRVWIRQLRTLGSSTRDIAAADAELSEQLAAVYIADEEAVAEENAPEESFEHELRLTIRRSFEENLDIDIASLEINNLRMSLKGQLDDMRRILIQETLKFADVGGLPGSIKTMFSRWGGLIKKTLSNNLEQVMVIDIVERFCALEESLDESTRGRLFVLSLRFLYEFDIVEDLAIIYWYNKASEKANSGSGAEEISQDLVQKIATFVEWLEESSEEEEDSDEDEDDDSDEDSE
ncbi:translation initiation factor eIF-2B epsilon subunit, GEF [Coemansia sp. IMI 203386]|nr:translation initiation factor eIF-2B epsilon subunit, GEF [Coemansia sp. IMI 203386]